MTLHGYRKELVVVKNLDSRIIDEALFFLKEGAESNEEEVVREANEIIGRSKELRAIKKRRPRVALAEFFIGAAMAAVIFMSLLLIFC